MRTTTIISLILSIILAIAAVLVSKSWLSREWEALSEQTKKDVEIQNYVVVAAGDLAAGDKLGSNNLELLPWASDSFPEGAFRNIDELVSNTPEAARYVLTTFAKGELVTEGKITKPGEVAKLSSILPEDKRAISIRVNDVLGVAGFVLPGDRADIFLTRTSRNETTQSFVDVLLENILILAVDQKRDQATDKPAIGQTVTVEVTVEQAQKLTLASNVGTLSLALRKFGARDLNNSTRISLDDLDRSKIGETKAIYSQEPEETDLTLHNTDEEMPAIKPKIEVGVTRNGQRKVYSFDAN